MREYAGPLGVLAAAGIGFSLLCSVSALAMNDLNSYVRAPIQPLNLVDLAIDNLSTSAALTQQAVTAFVPTPTFFPTHTASLTPFTVDTATIPSSPTRPQRTPTRRARPAGTVPVPFLPTQTRTPLPTSTKTSVPTSTNTAIPPTDTPLPPTDTPIPDTDTPLPETATSIPPTDTEVPPATQTELLPTEVPTQSSNSTEP